MSAYDQFLTETKSATPSGSPSVVPPQAGDRSQPASPARLAYDVYKSETSPVVSAPAPRATTVTTPTATPQAEQPSLISRGVTKIMDWFNKNQQFADEQNFKMRELMGQGSKTKVVTDPVTGKQTLTSDALEKYKTATPEEKAKLVNDSNINSVPLLKFLNSSKGKEVTGWISRNTSDLPLKAVAGLRALGEETYDQAYASLEAGKNDPTNPYWQKILYGVQDSGVQSAVGVLVGLSLSILSKGRISPVVGSAPFFTAISAEDQRQQKGQVNSVGNLAIDTVGDTVLSGLTESALKAVIKEGGETMLKQILKNSAKGFTVEGSTEVAQSFLKYANDYKNAQSEEQKAQIVQQAKDYVKNGGMATEFLVGGISGGIITGGATAIGGTGGDPNINVENTPPEKGSAFEKFTQEQGGQQIDLSKPAIELQQAIEGSKPAQGEANAGLQGIDRENKTKLTYEQATPLADKATEIYWDNKIKPELEAGKPAVIGADDLKDYFGNDYNDNNHPVYSQSAFKLFELGLQRVPEKKLILTAGGAGAGKTEIVTKQLINRGFKGMIYDSNLANYEGAVKQIEKAKEAGFDVEIYGVLPDLERARKFTILRQNKVGRGISDATFARGHAGFPAVLQKLLEENKLKESDVKLLDTRKIDSLDKAIDAVLNKEYVTNVLDTIKNLGYNEDNIKQTYAKDNFDQSTGQRTKGEPSSGEGSRRVSPQDGGDQSNAKRGGDREGIPRETKRKARSGSKQEEGVKTPKEEKKKTRPTLHFIKGAPTTIEKKVSSEGDILGVPVFTYKNDNGKYVVIDKKTGLSMSQNTYSTMKTAIEKEKEFLVKKFGSEEKFKEMAKKAHEMALDKYSDVFSLAGSPSGFASIGRYREQGDIRLGQYDQVKPIRFPELLDLAKELSGNVPFLKNYKMANGMMYAKDGGYIGLNPDLFKRENLEQLEKTFAHEIGHLIDYLPDRTMTRGNVMGRLAVLNGFHKDFFDGAGATRTNSEVREQLWNLSKYWKPIDEATAPKSFLEYRKSAPEVYADFISVLFNDPNLAGEIAPTAYNIFFEQLDKKPEVKKAYFELQDLLHYGDIIGKRRSAVKRMFKETEQLSRERQIENQQILEEKERSVWFKLKNDLLDITEAVKEDVKRAQGEGKVINPDDNPTYYLEERNYIGGKIKSEVDTKFNSIYQRLQADGMTWEDLGELMFYERILKGDRGDVANPLGYQPDFVQELMDVYDDVGQVKPDQAEYDKGTSDMKTTLGEDKFARLQELAKEYRSNLKTFFEEGYNEGIYNEGLKKMFEENAFYVPFKGAKYSGVTRTTFGVKHQKGTLGNIENPANTGIEKAVSIIRAIERNKVSRKTIEFYKENFPSEVQEAERDKNGYPRDPKDKSLGLVTYMEDGKVKGYYVDAYIAEAIKKTPSGEMNQLIQAVRFFNSGLFRPLFITFNLGFQSFNLIRDFKRFWKNIPDMTILKAMKLYSESARASKIRAFGLPENPTQADREAYDLINKLESDKIISITYNDILKGEQIEDAQIDRILRETGVRETKQTNLGKLGEKFGVTKESPIIKQALGILEFIEKTGNLIETIPKVAGVKALEGKMSPIEMRSYVRKYIGSPDFLAGGRDKKSVNEIFLFANAIAQGIRSDYEIATQPKTRGAYWLKTAKSELLPKLLMIMASAGLFGDWLKELFGKASEYDKANYTIIPLGEDENGKAIYFRMPSDETGRLIGGVFWKMAQSVQDPKKLADIETYTNLLNYAGGQVPSLSPVVGEALFTIPAFVAGQNPYDFFRGRPILTDEQQLAGGMERVKPFLSYLFQQMGGNVIMKLAYNETVPKNPSLSEKIINLPVLSNIAGRFIKVTDYGETEKIRAISNEIRSENAKQNLENRRVVFNYVDQAKDVSPAERQALKRDMIREILGSTINTPELRRQKTNLEKRFDTLLIRGKADPKIDSLITAQSNEEKVALLTEFSGSMSKSDFEELRKFIIKNKVVSPEAYQTFIRSVNNTKK